MSTAIMATFINVKLGVYIITEAGNILIVATESIHKKVMAVYTGDCYLLLFVSILPFHF